MSYEEGHSSEWEENRDENPVYSITEQYGDYYNEYVDENSDQTSESSEDDPETPHGLEKILIKTIRQFATFVASITKDLEEKEEASRKELEQRGEPLPKAFWKDSTFKVEFTKGLILKTFKPSRLMKYYIVILFPMKKWIENRNEQFFLKAKIFPGAPEKDIAFFRALWSDDILSVTEKDTIWEYWDTQIEIVEDWEEKTGWVVNDKEGLNIPDIDYDKAAIEAGIH
jgi:hypothetical protein